jgi:hypothetical protein
MKEKKKPDQPKLFDDTPQPTKIRDDFPVHVRARNDDDETAQRWARNVDASSTKWQTLIVMLQHGRCSSKKVAEILGKQVQDVSPVFAPLRRAKLIQKAGIDGNWTEEELTPLGREFALRLIGQGGK